MGAVKNHFHDEICAAADDGPDEYSFAQPAPQYLASGGCIFQREHVPMTMEAARAAVSLHRLNATYWLTEGEERTLATRISLAKTEMALANELEAAIAEITQPERKAA